MVEIDTAVDKWGLVAGPLVGTPWGAAAYLTSRDEKKIYSLSDREITGLAGLASFYGDYKTDEVIDPEFSMSVMLSATAGYHGMKKLDKKYENWRNASFSELEEDLDPETKSDLDEFD